MGIPVRTDLLIRHFEDRTSADINLVLGSFFLFSIIKAAINRTLGVVSSDKHCHRKVLMANENLCFDGI